MDDFCSGLSIYGKGGGSDTSESFRVSDFKSTTFHMNFNWLSNLREIHLTSKMKSKNPHNFVDNTQ